jgi:uncharacterized protein (DUF924 family)
MRSWFVPILQFWFGDVDSLGRSDVQHSRRWFMKDAAFDREIADRFGETYADVRAGRREGWLDDPRGRVAYVIVLDQFPRNMFRGTGKAFATDAQALAVAEHAIARGHDLQTAPPLRAFFYLPFMHSENGADQDRCVMLIGERLGEGSLNYPFALGHREVIRKFGRFPGRNAPLGRATTPEEKEFLKSSHPNVP